MSNTTRKTRHPEKELLAMIIKEAKAVVAECSALLDADQWDEDLGKGLSNTLIAVANYQYYGVSKLTTYNKETDTAIECQNQLIYWTSPATEEPKASLALCTKCMYPLGADGRCILCKKEKP